jgi:hypothetical protein
MAKSVRNRETKLPFLAEDSRFLQTEIEGFIMPVPGAGKAK